MRQSMLLPEGDISLSSIGLTKNNFAFLILGIAILRKENSKKQKKPLPRLFYFTLTPSGCWEKLAQARKELKKLAKEIQALKRAYLPSPSEQKYKG